MAPEDYERRYLRRRVFGGRAAPRRYRRHGFGQDARLGQSITHSGFGNRHHLRGCTFLHRQPRGDGDPLLQINLVNLVCPCCRFPSLCGNPTQYFEQSASCRRHRHPIGGHARILCDAVAHQQPLAPHLQRDACKHTGRPKQPCIHMHCHRNGHQHCLCPGATRS